MKLLFFDSILGLNFYYYFDHKILKDMIFYTPVGILCIVFWIFDDVCTYYIALISWQNTTFTILFLYL